MNINVYKVERQDDSGAWVDITASVTSYSVGKVSEHDDVGGCRVYCGSGSCVRAPVRISITRDGVEYPVWNGMATVE